jgi:hypothetical protein
MWAAKSGVTAVSNALAGFAAVNNAGVLRK